MEVKTLTSTERRAAIGKALAGLTCRMPADWSDWDGTKTAQFKADVLPLPGAKSFNKAEPIAKRTYGKPWATIDPGAA